MKTAFVDYVGKYICLNKCIVIVHMLETHEKQGRGNGPAAVGCAVLYVAVSKAADSAERTLDSVKTGILCGLM
jgi:hypothetical protein